MLDTSVDAVASDHAHTSPAAGTASPSQIQFRMSRR